MINQLQRPFVLSMLFSLALLLTFSFTLIGDKWGMVFLDSISSPEDARTLIASFSAEQIQVHVWTTSVIDVAYPLVYGSFLIGVALSCFGRFGIYFALPSILVIPVDLIEGVVQVLALLDLADLLDWKAVLTPAKFFLFLTGLGIAVLGWVVWVINKLRT